MSSNQANSGSEETSVTKPSTDIHIRRYERMLAGESIDEIAAADAVTPRQVEESIRRGQTTINMRHAQELHNLRAEALIEAERFRKGIRRRFQNKAEEALSKLLEGKRIVTSIDKATGEILIKEFVDPDILALGMEQFRKSASLEEKPGPGMVVNNVQNNNTLNAGAGGERKSFDFETAISDIRREQQKALSGGEPIIDVEPIDPRAEQGGEKAWEF